MAWGIQAEILEEVVGSRIEIELESVQNVCGLYDVVDII